MTGLVERRVKAAVLEEFRHPFKVGETTIRVPEDWVEVEVKAVGVCGRDLVVWKGGFQNLRKPLILGHEVFGIHNGRPVTVIPGIRVEECVRAGGECPGYAVLGEHVPGGYADRIYVPRENIYPLPDDEFEKYAAATCGVATIIHASAVAGIRAGEKVLVTGATGGVGIHGIQYLLNLGARVYAMTRSEEKARVLEGLGAIPVTSPDFYKNQGRMDVVLEIVGAPTFNTSMRSLRLGGRMVLIGNITGEPVTIERQALFVMREIHLHGSAAFTPEEWIAAIKVIGRGAIRPFYKAYRLDEINEAYKVALEGKRIGRVILKP
jgi:D-arabinose 1-dehydrogenase-like Zn-dependent alcohol dehydrogenase